VNDRLHAWPLMPLVRLVLVRSTEHGRREHAVNVKNMYIAMENACIYLIDLCIHTMYVWIVVYGNV
jgi:hypothetical protein